MIVEANAAAATLLGKPQADLLSTRLETYLSPVCRQLFAAFLAREVSSEARGRHSVEATVLADHAAPIIVRIEAERSEIRGRPEWHLALIDVIEMRRSQDEVHRLRAGLEHDVRVRTNELEASFTRRSAKPPRSSPMTAQSTGSVGPASIRGRASRRYWATRAMAVG